MGSRKRICFRIANILVFVFSAALSFSQILPDKGVPKLTNYTPAQYQNQGKIWDISSAPNGIVYMAADKGLLEFDGKTWNHFKGSEGITRSVLAVNDSVIYTGSDLDFGVWNRTRTGAFAYNSLYPFRKDLQEKNEEFWDVHVLHGDVLFISSRNIYQIKDQQVIRISAPAEITGSFLMNDTLYVATATDGVYVYDRVSLNRFIQYPKDAKYEIEGIYHDQGMVLVTRNAGLLRYAAGELVPVNSAISNTLKSAKAFSFSRIGPSHLAFGTVTKGLFITNLEGHIVHHINKYKGLLSNTTLCLHSSASGKLWMGMDYGISTLSLIQDITYFYDYRGDYGTGYVAGIVHDKFYLGTNQGLYQAPWADLNNGHEFTGFKLVPGTEGQVWALRNMGGTLLIGHDKGLFSMNGASVQKLSDHEGVWTIVPYGDYLLTGNYNGIDIYEKSENRWVFRNKMDLIMGSCNQLLVDEPKNLWVNIPNYGIIRVVLDENLSPVQRLIFPANRFSGDHPSIVMHQNTIQLITDQEQYTYVEEARKFVRVQQSLRSGNAENLLPQIYLPIPLHPDYHFYPIHNGFALQYLKYHHETPEVNPGIVLRRTEAFNNHETLHISPGDHIPFRLNNVRIHFIVPNYDGVIYQYRVNDDTRWKASPDDHSVELIGLRYGIYTLHLRALIDGKVISEVSMPFRIAVPWYRSNYAAFALCIVLIILMIGLRRWHLLMLKKQKKKMLLKEQKSLRKLAEKHREKIVNLEQARLQEEYEQVKQQLKNKTIELATKAKDSEDQNRLLQALKEKFHALQNDPDTSRFRLREINRLLETCLKIDDQTFQIQMDELHQDFFRKLKEGYPALSGNDLRLCAYLKVGLNSKEIAEILNIQPSSSYISRSRLRKKLNLRPDEDLYDFLNAI